VTVARVEDGRQSCYISGFEVAPAVVAVQVAAKEPRMMVVGSAE
jgi:hypothetical protein